VLSYLPSGVALCELLRTVGPTVAELAFAPEGRAVTVCTTVIEDVDDVLPATPGGLLLLVGIAPGDAAARRSLRRASDGGCAGVVVKRRGQSLDALVDAASAAGVAVVVAAEEIAWRHLDALLSSALTSASSGRADEGDAEGDELFSIANAIAAVVGGSVAIEDLAQHVLAYSSIPGQRIDGLRRQGILDRRVPLAPDDLEMYRRVLASDSVVRFPPHGEELPRAAVALRAGTLPLGTLWAIEGEDGLSRQAERALTDGARLAALHMLRARSALDLDRFRRGELLRALLEATGTPESIWPRLGFGPGDRVAIIGLAPNWSLDGADALLITHVAHEAGRVSHVLRPDAPVTTSARAVYVLVAGPHAGDAATRLAGRIVADASRSLGGRIYAAVSSEARGPRSIPRLRDEVDQILRVSAGGSGAPDVATISDVQSSVLLAHLADELERHPELRHPALARLIEEDERRSTRLATSLLAWLEAQQNVQIAATRLHVHPNTLRYRLRRIAELAPIDLDDADQRLATWLQLRLHGQLPGVVGSHPGARRLNMQVQ
jgi:DNA-binding PucR family transcriptional regulator